MAQKRLLFIFNPRAGRSKSHAPLFEALADLSEAGYWVSIRRTATSGDATRLVIQEGMDCDVVVAVGGDGTLNETVSGLMALDNPPILGYLPQGSTNDFAASLQISGNPKEAAALILKNEPRQLDIGLWDDRYFVYVASFGAFSSTSYTAAQTTKNALGHFAYILEGVKDLNSLRPYQLRVTADGEVLDGKYVFGAVCNSTSIGGLMRLDPEQVVLDDGKFEFLLVPAPTTATEFQNLIFALLNQQYDSRGLIFRHVSSVHLETDEDLPWSLDGEYAPSLPVVEIKNHRQALAMLL